MDLYHKSGKTWKRLRSATTNKKGVVSFNVKSSKTAQYQLSWKPAKSDKEEYATSTSGTVTVTIVKK